MSLTFTVKLIDFFPGLCQDGFCLSKYICTTYSLHPVVEMTISNSFVKHDKVLGPAGTIGGTYTGVREVIHVPFVRWCFITKL